MEESPSFSCTSPGSGECPLLVAMNLGDLRDSDLAGQTNTTTTSEGPELLLEMLEMRWWREDY